MEAEREAGVDRMKDHYNRTTDSNRDRQAHHAPCAPITSCCIAGAAAITATGSPAVPRQRSRAGTATAGSGPAPSPGIATVGASSAYCRRRRIPRLRRIVG
ncbi:predicted protein [Chaetomium globosum CBS 148.51]|uniref:Uncharacterized protein n=1 Tax=Chaetomium globosum (strain ATCC 6205 / CBS 148.51 / DSM 1962 / NBRC 6347 / NRRL 1970) TaxID=306901 RepID=Q2GS51_CHAGB|nr:uncharacterized protein CHGG_09203 [Chaetomium globosum CBS 148.51]EAQ85189.1 predicted protein [Chaetomium globosum CBS 148.51]